MITVQVNGVSIELPRLVKKPGEYKAVSTEKELRDAFADGWVLRLNEPVGPLDGPPAEAPAPAADPFPDVLDDPDGTPPAEEDEPAPDAPKRGRYRKGG